MDLNFLSSWITFILISTSAPALSPGDSDLQSGSGCECLSSVGSGEVTGQQSPLGAPPRAAATNRFPSTLSLWGTATLEGCLCCWWLLAASTVEKRASGQSQVRRGVLEWEKVCAKSQVFLNASFQPRTSLVSGLKRISKRLFHLLILLGNHCASATRS